MLGTLALIKKYGFVVGPRFKPGFPPHPRTGYLIYRDWVSAYDDHLEPENRPLAEATTLDAAVKAAVKKIQTRGNS